MRRHRDAAGREVNARGVVLRRIPGHTEEALLIQDDQGNTLAYISSDGVIYSRAGFTFPGYSTAQRDAIPQVDRPTGLVVRNTDINQLEEQIGTPAAPVWRSVASTAAEINQAGPLASRPPATAVPIGTQYFATDDQGGTVYRTDGTQWVRVTPAVNDARFQINKRGPLSDRPPASSVGVASFYFATDQVVLYQSDGASWTRALSVAAGDIFWTLNNAAEPGRILCQGQGWPSTTGIYADLYAKWGGAALPDLRGRVPVAVSPGGKALVAGIGGNDGLPASLRNISHAHFMHPATAYMDIIAWHSGSQWAGEVTPNRKVSGDADNTNYPAFFVLQAEAKL